MRISFAALCIQGTSKSRFMVRIFYSRHEFVEGKECHCVNRAHLCHNGRSCCANRSLTGFTGLAKMSLNFKSKYPDGQSLPKLPLNTFAKVNRATVVKWRSMHRCHRDAEDRKLSISACSLRLIAQLPIQDLFGRLRSWYQQTLIGKQQQSTVFGHFWTGCDLFQTV